jgi:hypothetical protein
MHTTADAPGFQAAFQLVPAHLEGRGNPDCILVENVPVAGDHPGRHQPVDTFNNTGEKACVSDSGLVEGFQMLQLAEADDGGNLGHAGIVAEHGVAVALALPVVSEQTALLGDIFVTGGNHPAFTGGHVLGGIEGKASGSKGTGSFAVVQGAMSLAGIFYQCQVMERTDVFYGFDIKGLAIKVDADNCPGVRGYS